MPIPWNQSQRSRSFAAGFGGTGAAALGKPAPAFTPGSVFRRRTAASYAEAKNIEPRAFLREALDVRPDTNNCSVNDVAPVFGPPSVADTWANNCVRQKLRELHPDASWVLDHCKIRILLLPPDGTEVVTAIPADDPMGSTKEEVKSEEAPLKGLTEDEGDPAESRPERKKIVLATGQLTLLRALAAANASNWTSVKQALREAHGTGAVWGIGAESLEKAMQMDIPMGHFVLFAIGKVFRDGKMLDDAVELDSAMDLQVLTMPPQFSDASDVQLERLYDAAKDGLVEEVEDLLQERLHPDAGYDKWNWEGPCTPLMLASSLGRLQVVQLLLEAGAQVELDDSSRFTALMHAAYNGHAQVVQLLLESGSHLEDCDYEDSTALMFAAGFGHAEVVKVLLDAGARKDACDIVSGHTALMRASINGHAEVTELLLEAKAQVNLCDKELGTPLSFAANEGHAQVVQLLLAAGANPNLSDSYNFTSLMQAASHDHAPIVRLLLEAGADVDARDYLGSTALMGAASSGHAQVVQLLLDAGAQKDLHDGDGRTALMLATDAGHDAVRRLLGPSADSAS
ncbi:kidins220b [Symbiodinium sp. CCMP2592]|nr:kidins220b [Symbiodinium sp. CCMP2592]